MWQHSSENNNYPNWSIKKTFNQFKFSKIQEQEQKLPVTLPYLPNITKILTYNYKTKYQSMYKTSLNN